MRSWFCFPSFWVAKLGTVLSKGHIFQFFEENRTVASALKFSSYVTDHKQHHGTGLIRRCSGPGRVQCELIHLVVTSRVTWLLSWPTPTPNTINFFFFYWDQTETAALSMSWLNRMILFTLKLLLPTKTEFLKVPVLQAIISKAHCIPGRTKPYMPLLKQAKSNTCIHPNPPPKKQSCPEFDASMEGTLWLCGSKQYISSGWKKHGPWGCTGSPSS